MREIIIVIAIAFVAIFALIGAATTGEYIHDHVSFSCVGVK